VPCSHFPVGEVLARTSCAMLTVLYPALAKSSITASTSRSGWVAFGAFTDPLSSSLGGRCGRACAGLLADCDMIDGRDDTFFCARPTTRFHRPIVPRAKRRSSSTAASMRWHLRLRSRSGPCPRRCRPRSRVLLRSSQTTSSFRRSNPHPSSVFAQPDSLRRRQPSARCLATQSSRAGGNWAQPDHWIRLAQRPLPTIWFHLARARAPWPRHSGTQRSTSESIRTTPCRAAARRVTAHQAERGACALTRQSGYA
jgi:hypothetical protein